MTITKRAITFICLFLVLSSNYVIANDNEVLSFATDPWPPYIAGGALIIFIEGTRALFKGPDEPPTGQLFNPRYQATIHPPRLSMPRGAKTLIGGNRGEPRLRRFNSA